MGILLARLIRHCSDSIYNVGKALQHGCHHRGLDVRHLTSLKNGSSWTAAFLAIFISACSSDPQLAPDSTIRITPGSQNFEITELLDDQGNCIFIPGFFQDLPISLAVINSSNQVVGNANVTVFTDFSGNTFSGPEFLQLFSDSNGNGVVDSPDELVSGVDDDAFSIRTDRFSGTANLLLRVNLSCEFRGNVYAFSGVAAGISEIGVTAISSN